MNHKNQALCLEISGECSVTGTSHYQGRVTQHKGPALTKYTAPGNFGSFFVLADTNIFISFWNKNNNKINACKTLEVSLTVKKKKKNHKKLSNQYLDLDAMMNVLNHKNK